MQWSFSSWISRSSSVEKQKTELENSYVKIQDELEQLNRHVETLEKDKRVSVLPFLKLISSIPLSAWMLQNAAAAAAMHTELFLYRF